MASWKHIQWETGSTEDGVEAVSLHPRDNGTLIGNESFGEGSGW